MWKTSLHTSLLCILPCPCLYWGRRRVNMNFLLLFTCLCVTHGQPDVIGSDKPVTVTVGDDVILPCHLGPPFNVRTLTVEWTRDGQYVHVWRQGKDYLNDQDENFRGRTSPCHEAMIRGNISLKLTSVTELDAGSYTCIVPKLQSQVKKNFIILTVEPGKVKDPGQSDVIGSDKPVTVTVGDNVILPCHLEPPFDVRTQTVEWKHDGRFVHVSRHEKDYLTDQYENFRGRTSVFYEEMIRGNISLKLTNVTEMDAGSYTCFVPGLQSQVRRGFINLAVEPMGGQTGDTNTESANLQLICSHQPITALAGDDVILPCHLEPPISVSDETVEWTRPDLDPKYIHFHQDGRLMFDYQNPSYYLRTRLFMDGLMTGNVSMKIFKVKVSDTGRYQCALPSLQKEASIQLIVGESDVIGSDKPVTVTVGDNAILPCHLEPPSDMRTQTVEWTCDKTIVHVYRNRKDYLDLQYENFRGRTSLFHEEMIRGNISLKLTNVTELDAGSFTCNVPKLQSQSQRRAGTKEVRLMISVVALVITLVL